MHRRVEAAKFITTEHRGIEIAPFHDGLVPKRLGYQCLILDVFDTQTLRDRASKDPYVDQTHLADIESVDLVGSATEIARLVEQKGLLGQLDYVVSSHNLEHLPDPISFLQGCSAVLKPGGVVSMVLPDRRVSFDHFRPQTILADVIEAFLEKRERPTAKQVFTHASLHCHYLENGVSSPAFQLTRDPLNIEPWQTLREGWQGWQAFIERPDTEYRDTHCWAFTPASLELLLRDLDWLGFIDFEVLEVSELRSHEFFVHLRKPVTNREKEPAEAFYARRKQLLRATNAEAGIASFPAPDAAGLQQQLGQARARVAELEAAAGRVAALEAEVTRLSSSRSWKLTRPLRVAGRLLRRLGPSS